MTAYNFYYRTGLTPTAVKRLILANVIVYLLQVITRHNFNHIFGLVPADIINRHMYWQVVTYMFLHGGIFHLVFNMFALWMFGQDIEREWGAGEFLRYYFLTGIGAGLLTYLFSPHSVIPTVGASGAIFGLLTAYGMMFPENVVLVFFIFPMRAKYFVLLFGVIEFLACLEYTSDGIGHFAHVGGMLIGFIYLKFWPRFTLKLGLFRGIRWRIREWQKERQKEGAIIFDEKVDTILDKINRAGMESLNSKEKEILRRYRERK